MKLYGPLNTGVAVGGAGVATATSTSDHAIRGRVVGVYLLYNDTPPATTDVTLKTRGTSPAPPTYNILVRTDQTAGGWFYPRVQVHDTAGTAIAGEYTPLLVSDYLQLVIAQANAADSIDAWLLLDEDQVNQ